eukprot:gene11159-14973_t
MLRKVESFNIAFPSLHKVYDLGFNSIEIWLDCGDIEQNRKHNDVCCIPNIDIEEVYNIAAQDIYWRQINVESDMSDNSIESKQKVIKEIDPTYLSTSTVVAYAFKYIPKVGNDEGIYSKPQLDPVSLMLVAFSLSQIDFDSIYYELFRDFSHKLRLNNNVLLLDIDNDPLPNQNESVPKSYPKINPLKPADIATFCRSSSTSSSFSNLSHTSASLHNGSRTSAEYESSFLFPLDIVPLNSGLSQDMDLCNNFMEFKYFANGSTSDVFDAVMLSKQRVAVKIIKKNRHLKSSTVKDFKTEFDILSRLNHPNIITVLGCGSLPREFIVLEYLDGLTLQDVLKKNERPSNKALKLFHRPSFKVEQFWRLARELAVAMEYLHFGVFPSLTIVHRDLKPANIGFSLGGTLKVLDFGLARCIRSRQSEEETYALSPGTGSFRYMAPEVALKQPYTELVDVYSYGIILWQAVSDKVPYRGFNEGTFMDRVVYEQLRPNLNNKWSVSFNEFLQSCWHPDPFQRPSFTTIISRIDVLSQNTCL